MFSGVMKYSQRFSRSFVGFDKIVKNVARGQKKTVPCNEKTCTNDLQFSLFNFVKNGKNTLRSRNLGAITQFGLVAFWNIS